MEASWSVIAPTFHAEAAFPTRQVVGYAASIVLTLVAFLLVIHHALPATALIAVILALGGIQAAVQLGLFLHVKESVGPAWQVLTLGIGITVGLGIVGFSIWIVAFHWGAF